MLEQVVRDILEGDVVPAELLVVENSKDGHPQLASFTTEKTRFRYLSTTATTLSAKRNMAINGSSNPLIVICDDDVSVPRKWLGEIVAAASRAGPNTIVTGRVIAGPEEIPGAFAPSLHPSAEPVVYTRRSSFEDPLATFNCAFDRTVFARVGDFDTRLGPGTAYPSCEDNDFGLRALELGVEIAFEPRALLLHRSWRPRQAYVALRWRYGLGQGAFYAKHLGRNRFIWMKLLAAWRRHARRGWSLRRQVCIGEIAWFAGFICGLPRWAAQHRILPALRRSLPRSEDR